MHVNAKRPIGIPHEKERKKETTPVEMYAVPNLYQRYKSGVNFFNCVKWVVEIKIEPKKR